MAALLARRSEAPTVTPPAVTMNTLLLPEIQSVLNRLHALAESRDDAIIPQVRGSGSTWAPFPTKRGTHA